MRIAFVTKMGPANWAGNSLETGIGGSEAMIILYAEEFARLGHEVICYVTTNLMCDWNGVSYRTRYEYEETERHDLAIAVRDPSLLNIRDEHRWFLANDQRCPELAPAVTRRLVQRIVTISKHQAERYKYLYPGINAELFIQSSAGVDDAAFLMPGIKNSHQCVYTSSPERGLRHFVSLWPRVLEKVPDATLKITGGFELYGAGKETAKKMSAGVYDAVCKLPNVTYLGPVTRTALRNLLAETAVWAYPTDYDEMCCISALEASSARCALLTSKRAALKERVRSGYTGYLIDGTPGNKEYDDAFVEKLVYLLTHKAMREEFGRAGRKYAAQHDYRILAEQWLKNL